MDIDALAGQIARNCLVADAHRWGYFSLCGLLLRLRDLYKRESGLEPWARVETSDVLPWVGEREAAWARLEDAPYEPLTIGDARFDPLDEDAINALLLPSGWLYTAGHGPGGLPLFVLGEIVERRAVDGAAVFVLGRERVHDLVPVPALSRPGHIVARRSATLGHLWSTLEEAAGAREPGPAAAAVAIAGGTLAALVAAPQDHAALLGDLASRQLEAAILHEIGELAEDRRCRGRWEALLLRTTGTRAELLARALKDALADAGASGLLQGLIARRDPVPLALRAASGLWLHKKIFPEVRAIWDAAGAGLWSDAEQLRRSALARLERHAESLFGLFADDPTHEEAARRAEAFEKELTGTD